MVNDMITGGFTFEIIKMYNEQWKHKGYFCRHLLYFSINVYYCPCVWYLIISNYPKYLSASLYTYVLFYDKLLAGVRPKVVNVDNIP